MNGVTEPCPWCRGATIKTRHLGQWAGVDMYAALCQTEGCGATGPTRDTEPAAIAAWNRRADRWMPIETAPTDGTVVLVYAPATDPAKWAIDLPEAICTAVYHEDAGWCICTVRDVTHWRPLPTPPAGDAP